MSTETSVKTHTAGPWTAKATSIDDVVEIRDGEGRQLASVYAVEYTKLRPVTVEETAANARLIAAAPEMLEALDFAVDALYANHASDSAIAYVVDAIRKAKGEV